MGWQTEVVVQLLAGNSIINPNGFFVYSSTPAAGNLIFSIAAGGVTVDNFGNHLAASGIGGGAVSYASGFAVAISGGQVEYFTGSLATTWNEVASIVLAGAGGILLSASGGSAVTTNNNTLDDGSGNTRIATSLSVAGSTQTTQNGLSSPGIVGTSGPASAGTAHTHSAGSYVVGSGQHKHSSFGG